MERKESMKKSRFAHLKYLQFNYLTALLLYFQISIETFPRTQIMTFAINKIKRFLKSIHQKRLLGQLLSPKKRAHQSTFYLSEQEKDFLKIPLIFDELTRRKEKESPYFIGLEEKFSYESIIFEMDNYYDNYPLLRLRIKLLYIFRYSDFDDIKSQFYLDC